MFEDKTVDGAKTYKPVYKIEINKKMNIYNACKTYLITNIYQYNYWFNGILVIHAH